MVDVPPEVHSLAIKIKNKYGKVRAMSPDFWHRIMEDAEEYNGLYIAYWECQGVRSLFTYRKDRTPTDAEVALFAQELFEDGDIHRDIGPRHMWCVQGNVYTIDTVADMAGKAFADAAAKTDSNAGEFDFDKTDIGKRLGRRLRNGTH